MIADTVVSSRFILKADTGSRPYEYLVHQEEIVSMCEGSCLADLLDYLADHCNRRWKSRDPLEVCFEFNLPLELVMPVLIFVSSIP